MNDFEQKLAPLLQEIFENNLLIKGILSNPKSKSQDRPQKITIKSIKIRNKDLYQISLHYQQKVIHQNYPSNQGYETIFQQLSCHFKQADLFTSKNDIQVLISKKGKLAILYKSSSKSKIPVEHNRKKNYLINEGVPIPFLIELGIFSPSGKVLEKKWDKFRQINRFLELVEDVFLQLEPRNKWYIIDFGCGKAYLTFALYYFLKDLKGLNVEMLGIDLKKDVIEKCQTLAASLGYDGLQFKVGDINHHKPDSRVDIMLSLHACDTATDAALEQAVRWHADAILSVPCCQHELYSQVSNSFLEPLLKHGILKERFAALVTDAARGQVLEILGYRTQILEFVDLEHTAKNLMIRAIREKSPSSKNVLLKKYLQYKETLSIIPSLEKRFKEELEDLENNCSKE
jgi:SAM-dependent methyltransferase